jgi:dCMP deaminase
MNNKWDVRFLKLAEQIASWSKDPSKKVGAVIVNHDRVILSTGYNGLPKGMRDTAERLNSREMKNELIVHAEMNAIYNASKNGISLDNSTLYCWGLPVCSKCSLGVISAGIKKVVMEDPYILSVRWEEEKQKTIANFSECGIEFYFVNVEKINAEKG